MENLVVLTEAAALQIKEMIKVNEVEGQYLRVAVQGGGCSGLTYGLGCTPYNPANLTGDGEKITHVTIEHATTKELKTIEVDSVIVNYGFVSSMGPIKDWDLEIEKNSLVVNSRMETNIPGIYAAGDICTYDGKVKLIISGFGEAPVAVNSAKQYVEPTVKNHLVHSTSVFEK